MRCRFCRGTRKAISLCAILRRAHARVRHLVFNDEELAKPRKCGAKGGRRWSNSTDIRRPPRLYLPFSSAPLPWPLGGRLLSPSHFCPPPLASSPPRGAPRPPSVLGAFSPLGATNNGPQRPACFGKATDAQLSHTPMHPILSSGTSVGALLAKRNGGTMSTVCFPFCSI